ncbi:MAG: hypothetical protein JST00_33525 [Deltaproteobacteria bacterium]|nr:hypothetical protein [Deltaproteobacteria bacterium]
MWEPSFVAVSILSGASFDDALAALPEGTEHRVGDLAQKLRDPRKNVRAAALAQAAHAVIVAVEESGLR